jgi:hypothetical protein
MQVRSKNGSKFFVWGSGTSHGRVQCRYCSFQTFLSHSVQDVFLCLEVEKEAARLHVDGLSQVTNSRAFVTLLSKETSRGFKDCALPICSPVDLR